MARTRLLIVPLAVALLGSTCIVVEEGPEYDPYGQESNEQAMEEEQAQEVITDSER